MEQIPEHNLLYEQFLLSFSVTDWDADTRFCVSTRCCMLRISESAFRDICRHLRAVISYEASFDPFSSIDPRIDLTRPYYDQGQWFHSGQSIINQVWNVHGFLSFYHKSFYDFLHDPTRSGAFCITTHAFNIKLLDHSIQDHHHYASSYAIDGSSMYFLLASFLNLLVILDLVSASGVISSSTALSWPHGTEFVDSYLKLKTFPVLSIWLSPDHPEFCLLFEYVPFCILQRLADVDYRKYLIADSTWRELEGSLIPFVFGIWGTTQSLSHTAFGCIRAEAFDRLVPARFLSVCFKYDYLQ